MTLTSSTASIPDASAYTRARGYPLFDALLNRRSRRFGEGMHMNGGPLAYTSPSAPRPLTLHEEAALAFSACGLTGPTVADMPFETGNVPESGDGNCLMSLFGRTVPSADAVHAVSVFVINDSGTWLLKRPQDISPSEMGDLVRSAREYQLVDVYERSRVQISAQRVEVARDANVMLAFNKWASNRPGTTYFLPVSDVTALTISAMFILFSESMGVYVLDDRNGFAPAGLKRHARSRGGHLHDNPRGEHMQVPLSFVEGVVHELAAIEQGMILQNLGLMTQALGLGGFVHFAAHPYAWFEALGFQTQPLAATRTAGAGPIVKLMARLLGQDRTLPTAVGLEQNGRALLKPFCPPLYRSMEEAVLAFVAYKFGPGWGTFRDGGEHSLWRAPATVQAGIPAYTERQIAATVDCCEYIYKRYGRFPLSNGPFRTTVAYQAHHLDTSFYDRFYRPDGVGGRADA